MMLYLANWGSRRLMFRFPKDAVDVEALKRYSIPYVIEVKHVEHYVIVDINLDLGDPRWVEEGEASLSPMTPLREQILRGDYRALYLTWLQACVLEVGYGSGEATINAEEWGYEEGDDDGFGDSEDEEDEGYEVSRTTQEPPVPPNLKHLNRPLNALIDYLEMDLHLVAAASEASQTAQKSDEPVAEWVAALTEAEAKVFLTRFAVGEPNTDIHLLAYLREKFGKRPAPTATTAPRTVGEIFDAADKIAKREAEAKRRKADAERLERVNALAKREDQAWETVLTLIKQKNVNAYDEAVKQLVGLRELAEHEKRLPAFMARVAGIQQQFPTLSGLKSRLKEAKLL